MAAATNQVPETERREAWLAQRRTKVTGTDLPAVLGLPGSFNTLAEVVLEKRQLLAKDERVPEWLEAGIRLQDANLIWYADKTGTPLEFCDPYALVECPDLPILGVSLDGRWAKDDRRPVDAKNVGYLDAEEWGEELTDEIPLRYIAQLHGQMLCTRTDVADLSVIAGGRRHVIFRVHRDEEICAAIVEAATEFHRRFIAGDEVPPVDASDGWTRLMNSRRQRLETYLVADEASEALALRYRAAKEQEKALAEEVALVGNQLRALIGDASGLQGSFGKLSYKQNKEQTVFDAEAAFAELARYAPDSAIVDRIRQQFTTTKPGARPLRPTWKKGAVHA